MAEAALQAQQPIRGFGSSKCPYHFGREVIYACEDCRELACVKCATSRHRGHVLDDLSEIIPEVNKNLQDCVSRLEQIDIPHINESLKAANDDLLKTKQFFENEIEEKEEQRRSLKKQLENVEKSLKALRNDELINVSRLQNHEQEVRSQIDERKSKLDEVKDALRSGSNVLKYDVANSLPPSTTEDGKKTTKNESLMSTTERGKSEPSDPIVFEVVMKTADRETGKLTLKLVCGSIGQYYKYHFLLKDIKKRRTLIKNLKENMLSLISTEYPPTLCDERTLKTWKEKDIADLSDMFNDLCGDLESYSVTLHSKLNVLFSDFLNDQPSVIEESVRQFVLNLKDRNKKSYCIVGYKTQLHYVMINVKKFIGNDGTVTPTSPMTKMPSSSRYQRRDDMEVRPGQTVGEGAKMKGRKFFSKSVRVTKTELDSMGKTPTISQLKHKFLGNREEQEGTEHFT